MEKKVIIIGSSGYAKVVVDIVNLMKGYSVVGFLSSDYKGSPSSFAGYKLIGQVEDIPEVIKTEKIDCGVIAIGDNWSRFKIVNLIEKLVPSFSFLSAVHPSSVVADNIRIGRGSVIMGGVTINSCSSIGEFCILNTNSSVDHDCEMENYSSVAPGSALGGNVKIGEFSVISIGVSVVHKINVGEQAVIGAGAVVLNDIPSYSVSYGVPAKVIRRRKAGDAYL